MDEPRIGARTAAGLCAQAEALMAVKRDAEAIPLLQQAMAAEPQRTRPRCLLALAFLHLRDHARALKAADDAVLLGPAEEWPHRLRSTILSQMGKRRPALDAAREAARLAPMLPESLFALASAELAAGQHRQARQSADRLRMLAPDRALSHQMLGLIALKARKNKEAEAHYRRAIELDPLCWQYMNNLGLALQRQGKQKEAIERFHDAARLDPTAETTRKNLSQAVARYGSVGFVSLWVAIRLLAWGIDAGGGRSAAPFIGCALFVIVPLGGLWWRRRRIQSLHPTVVAFYTDQERRQGRRVAAAIGLVGGTLVTLLWTASGLQEGAAAAGLQSWGLAFYRLIGVGTIAGYAIWGWRAWSARRARR